MTWPIIFLLVVLKIPVAYLCAVVWWAIKAEPKPEAPASLVGAGARSPDGPVWRFSVRRGSRPSAGPTRRPGGRRPVARAYARAYARR